MRLSPLPLALFACLPTIAHAQDLPPTAPTRDALSALADGMVLESLPGGFVLAAAPRAGAAVPDPGGADTYDRSVVLYLSGPDGLTRRVTVHHTLADRDDALRTARLTAAILNLHQRRFQRPARFPRDADAADVWLVRRSAPDAGVGGETRAHNVFVYGTATPRTDAEWVRTLTHELGHLILPAARGYAQPEGDAGGELGERLFQRWLVAEPPSEIWRLDGSVQAIAEKATPLTDRFRKRGPHDPTLRQRSAGGMELYLGAALAFEDAFGSALLGTALYGIDSTEPQELLDSMRRAVFAQTSVAVRLPAWVPFADDSFSFTPTAGKGRIAIDSRPAFSPDPARPLAIRKMGWKLVRAADGDLRAVRIGRKGR